MSETATQVALPAIINKVGINGDKFYIYASIKDITNDRDINALVRLKTGNELKEFYGGIYPDKDNEDLNTTTSSFIQNQGEKRQLQSFFNDFIQKGIDEGRFKGSDYADIMENQLTGIPFYIRNAKIIGEIPVGENAGQPTNNPNGDDDNTIKIVTAQTILGLGVKLGEEELNEFEAIDPTIADVKTEMMLVKVDYTPPTAVNAKAKPNRANEIDELKIRTASARFLKVDEVENFNAFQIKNDNRDFENAIYNAFKPMSDSESPENYTINNGRMEVNLNFAVDNKSHSYRLTFPSNTLYGSDLFDLSVESRRELSMQEDDSYEAALNDFIRMEDPYTQAKNPSDEVLVRNDILRVMLLASRQPNKFEEFREKVANNDPTAFEGVTKKNYMQIEEPNQFEKLALDYAKAVADNPRKVVHNVSVDKELNLAPKALNEKVKYLTSSFYGAADESKLDSSGKVTALAKTTNSKHHPAYDVFVKGKFGPLVKQMVMLVSSQEVPVMDPKGAQESNDGDDSRLSQETVKIQYAVPLYNFAPNPKALDGKGRDFRYDDENTLTQYNHTHQSMALHKKSTANIRMRGTTLQTDIIKGVGPDVSVFPDIMIKPENDKDFEGNYIPKNELLGVVGLAKYDGEVDNKNEFKVTLSEGEAGVKQHRVLSHYFFMNNFEKNFLDVHVPKLDVNGEPNEERTRLQSRFKEMMQVVQDVIGENFNRKLDYPNPYTKEIIRPLDASKGETELADPRYQKAREMLLSDKMVEHNGKEYNYSDVMYKMTNPSKYTPQPIRSDIADEIQKPTQVVPFEKTSSYKQDRVNTLAKEQQQKLVADSKTADEFANDIIAEFDNMQSKPEDSPRLRV